MNSFFRTIYFKIFSIVFIIFIWYFLFNKNEKRNDEICKTKEIEIKGIITAFGGHGIYIWTEVNTLQKSIGLNISKTLYKKGFSENYNYEKGDSIIKKAGSKEFTIKRGKNIAVYVLDCDD